MNERKIMSYPFTGFDYKDIMEVGRRVRVTNNEDDYTVSYIIPTNGIDGRHEISVNVYDEAVKNTLCYFSFLNSMCRYSCEVPVFRAIDQGLLSYNTYIDTILICANEIVSGCKICGVNPDSVEILSRFGKQYNPDDLHKLYSKPEDYNYINGLFSFLASDSYCVHASKFNDRGICFDKIRDGYVGDVVSNIINNKDDIEFFKSSKETVFGPQLIKKISNSQVI